MSRQDEIAAKAIRKSTLRSLKEKKQARMKQLKLNYLQERRNLEIQYAEDPERLKAKFASEEFAKSEKAKKHAAAKIEKEKTRISYVKNLRPYTAGEEIASSIIQGIGTCLFIAATAILDTLAIQNATEYVTLTATMYALFGVSMTIMYVCSCLQHALTNESAKEVFNRLSHVFSFLIIGFAYTAYSVTKLQGMIGWILFGIVWLICIIGAILYSVFSYKLSTLNIILYVVSGLSGIFVCKLLYQILSAQSFRLLMISAVLFIMGLIFYLLRKIKLMHVFGNVLMLSGSICLFFSLFFINL